MKSKVKTYSILLLLGITLMSGTFSYAKNKRPILTDGEHDLSPSTKSEIIIPNIKLIKEGDIYGVQVGGDMENYSFKSYHLSINPEDLSYTATKNDKWIPRSESFSYQVLGTWWIRLDMTTDDPVGEDLVETTSYLSWKVFTFGGNLYASKDMISTLCWAANPTQFGTHWYIDSCNTAYTWQISDTEVNSGHNGNYHNSEFGTTVTHVSDLTGHASGASEYWHVHYHQGDYSYLLDLDVTVSTGHF